MKVQKNLIIAIIVTAVVAGGGGFLGGMKYSESKTPARGPGQFTGNANRPGDLAAGRLRTGSGFVNGSILSKDDKSITVKDLDGGSKIVFFSGSTTIGKTTDGTAGDLATGINVMVSGTTNSDGSVTAKSIQIRPEGANQIMPNGAGPNLRNN